VERARIIATCAFLQEERESGNRTIIRKPREMGLAENPGECNDRAPGRLYLDDLMVIVDKAVAYRRYVESENASKKEDGGCSALNRRQHIVDYL